MPSSIHFINRPTAIGLEGLNHLGQGRYRSCCWLLTHEEMDELLGGWIYLHHTKADASTFGGAIQGFEPGIREQAANQDGFAIIFQAAAECLGQPWRGADHAMAYRSGLVEPTFAHELGEAGA